MVCVSFGHTSVRYANWDCIIVSPNSFTSGFDFISFGFSLTSSLSSDLKKNIETLEKNRVTCLRTSVNLGSEVYMQADVYVYSIPFILGTILLHSF